MTSTFVGKIRIDAYIVGAMGSTGRIAPAAWGSPPTALLPRWYIDNLASTPLPTALADALPSEAELHVIGDLPRFWEYRSEPLPRTALHDLVDEVSQLWQPPYNHIVIPAYTNIARLLLCPLKTRTFNCIKNAFLNETLKEDQHTTVSQLLSLKSFGMTSLLDVMCVIEAATEDGILLSFQLPVTTPLEPVGSLGDTAIADLTNGRSAPEEVLSILTKFKESLPPLEQQILEQRILAPKLVTLEELGQEFNLTRERVRQRQKPLESSFEQLSSNGVAITYWLEVISGDMRQNIDPITTESELERQIATTFPTTSSSDESVIGMARYLLRGELDYTLVGNWYLDKPTIEAIQILKEEADSLADSADLVNELELRNRIPHENLDQYWETVLELLGFHRFHGQLSPRDSQKARTKAALISIGRLATKEEISKTSGLPIERVTSHLSGLSGVVRASKTHWGLSDWIEEEYEGISTEIIQRIKEDGGATRLNRLVEELPRLFGVKEGSVRAYAQAPQFHILGQFVVLADESSVRTKPLEDVIDGHTEDGHPYWSFKVQEQYFRGYSVSNVPPGIAKYLGVQPNSRVKVPVLEPTECGDVSVTWRLTSISGAFIGFVTEPLKRLNAQVGDEVCVILHNAHSDNSDNASVSFALYTDV